MGNGLYRNRGQRLACDSGGWQTHPILQDFELPTVLMMVCALKHHALRGDCSVPITPIWDMFGLLDSRSGALTIHGDLCVRMGSMRP